jgi:hypothetical protein
VSRRRAALALVALCALGALGRAVRADDDDPPAAHAAAPRPADLPDYDPTSRAWNGLAGFVGMAQGAGYEVAPVAILDWGELDRDDILVLMYPLERVDPSRLSAFLEAGGAAMIADDFGEAKDAIARLGFVRAEVGTPQASKYWQDRPYAPIATTMAPHPITLGVDQVVANHPAVLTHVEGATAVVSFNGGDALIVAGERGFGRFALVADPSIFINRMLQFPGNFAVASNLLRWLGRGHAQRIVLVRGDVPMSGDPRPFIDDAGAGALGRAMGDINRFLEGGNEWLLTSAAMKAIAGALAFLLIGAALLAMPAWRRGAVSGEWLRFARPVVADDIAHAVGRADRGESNFRVAAAVLRDAVAGALAAAIDVRDPLYELNRQTLIERVTIARGADAGRAVTLLYTRLRGLPTRGQATAAYGGVHISRHEFDRLYEDAANLYRTLGQEPLP